MKAPVNFDTALWIVATMVLVYRGGDEDEVLARSLAQAVPNDAVAFDPYIMQAIQMLDQALSSREFDAMVCAHRSTYARASAMARRGTLQ